VPGGTVLLIGVDHDTPLPTSRNVLREIDLAGDVVRETNLAAVNAELAATGLDAITSFTFVRGFLAAAFQRLVSIFLIFLDLPTEFCDLSFS
jgi:hypothetical protein